MRVVWLVVCGWELESVRLSKGGQEVLCVWGQTWVRSFQGESSGDSYYVSWQPKRTQVSLSPAMCSTYKATGGKDPLYRQTCAAMGVRDGIPLTLALARVPVLSQSLSCASWKGAATIGHLDTQVSLAHTSVARQLGSPSFSFSQLEFPEAGSWA